MPTNGEPRCAGAATVIDRKTLVCKQFRLVAAGPGGVPTAMPETRLVADEDFAWAERVSIRRLVSSRNCSLVNRDDGLVGVVFPVCLARIV